jgi:hypothetical protein
MSTTKLGIAALLVLGLGLAGPACLALAQKPAGEEQSPWIPAVIRSVDAAKDTITVSMMENGQKAEKTVGLPRSVKIMRIINKIEQQEGSLDDLAAGTAVLLQLAPDGAVAGLRVLAGPAMSGIVKSVDPAKNTLTLTVKENAGLVEKTLDLAPNVRIVLADALSKAKDQPKAKTHEDGQLADLTSGLQVTLQMSIDRKTVTSVTIPPPSTFALVKDVDVVKNTITVTMKDGGQLVDETFDLSKDVAVTATDGNAQQEAGLADLGPGTPVVIRVSVRDRKTVTAISIRPGKTGDKKQDAKKAAP